MFGVTKADKPCSSIHFASPLVVAPMSCPEGNIIKRDEHEWPTRGLDPLHAITIRKHRIFFSLVGPSGEPTLPVWHCKIYTAGTAVASSRQESIR